MAQIVDRMIRAAKLKVDLYEEVEADTTATSQAMMVVVLASIAAGVGAAGSLGLAGLVVGTLSALLGWYVWAYITYIVGTKILPEPQTHADLGELLRTIGFSASPGVLRVLGIVAPLAPIIFMITGIWSLFAMVIAVRQALDYKSTGRAVGVCLIGWTFQFVLLVIMTLLFGAPG